MKQKLSYKEKKVNTKINEWIKLNLSDYYKTLTEDYTILKGISFKEFSARIRDLILNGCQRETPTILSDYYFYTEEKLRRLLNFFDDLKDKDTEELLNFNDDSKEFNEFEYYDSDDYYLETLNTIFNTKDISNRFKNDRENIFIIVDDKDFYINIKEEEKEYNTFKDFLEELEHNLLDEIDIEDLCIAYIYHHHFNVFGWFVDEKPIDKQIKKVIENIKKEIIEELPKRAKIITKELENQNVEFTILERYFEEVIINSNRNVGNLCKEKSAILKYIEDNKTKVE